MGMMQRGFPISAHGEYTVVFRPSAAGENPRRRLRR